MSTSYTSKLGLAKPANSDRNWGATANTTFDTIEALAPINAGNVTPTEFPSASLNVAIAAATVLKSDGTVGTYAGGTNTLAANTTTYLYLNSTLALNTNTSAWPTSSHIRLATAVTNTNTVTSITDARVVLEPILAPSLLLSGGTLADGANISLNTNTGTKIATNTTQKLGFYGATPVVQPTMGAATATNTWTNTERNMLQLVYNTVRTLGLGS